MEHDGYSNIRTRLVALKNDVTPTKVMTVTRDDLMGKPQVIGNSCGGVYPVREQMFERGMTSCIVHVDEFAYELPLGKPGQLLANGEKGPIWRDPPSK